MRYAILAAGLMAFLPIRANAYPSLEWPTVAQWQPYSGFRSWDGKRHPRYAKHHYEPRQARYGQPYWHPQNVRTSDRGQIVAHPVGCPARLFCGCGASIEVFGHSIRELWLAANWLVFPRAAPAPGMAVVFGRHHVAIIRQYHGDGTATLYDANSGNGLTRVHRVRIAGLTIVDPRGGYLQRSEGRHRAHWRHRH